MKIQGGTSTFYVLVNLGSGFTLPKAIKPNFTIVPEPVVQGQEDFFEMAWLVSLTALLILILNNLHLYYRFRDHTVLYFLIVQVGSILYITSYRQYFNVVFPFAPFSLLVKEDGTCYFYTFNQFSMHLSVTLIIYGGVQMTRAYFQTRILLPHLETCLRVAVMGYIAFSAAVALIHLNGFYLNEYTILYDNILVLLVALLLLIY